jgi:predicted kinase
MSTRQQGMSDADAEIARHMAATMAPWPTATAMDTEGGGLGGEAESSGAFCDLVQQALEVIQPHGPEHVWRPTKPVILPD